MTRDYYRVRLADVGLYTLVVLRMRLAELVGAEDYRVVEVDRPRPAAGELLVEVFACGVCASELDAWTGRVPADFPVRNGHEVSGAVAELGPTGRRLRRR